MFFSIHNIWVQRYLYKSEDWKLYSVLRLSDLYNFPKEAEYSNNIIDYRKIIESLNSMWYYHETELDGETYNFTIEIKELIK